MPACYDTDTDARAELGALFESTRLEDHMVAATICDACPVVDACRRLVRDTAKEFAWAGGPFGTWGGELWISGKLSKRTRPSTLRKSPA